MQVSREACVSIRVQHKLDVSLSDFILFLFSKHSRLTLTHYRFGASAPNEYGPAVLYAFPHTTHNIHGICAVQPVQSN